MTYEIVSTDSTPFGNEFYLDTGSNWQAFQCLYTDDSDVIEAVEDEFFDLLNDEHEGIYVPCMGTYSAGDLVRELMSETDQRCYVGDYAAQRYEQASFVEALNATQENTDWDTLVPEPEPGEPDSALELLADLDQDTRVVVELSPRGVRYRLPRELGIYKGARREWRSMDTDDIDGLTLTALLDEIYEKFSE